MENFSITEKVCLVTGSSRGIGRSIAETLADAGATVYATARNDGCLDEWADTLNKSVNGKIKPVYFDITNSEEIKKAVSYIKTDAGRIDVLVNNAGRINNEILGMTSIEEMRQMFDVNVFGLFELTQLVAMKIMKRQKSGSIINIASITAVEGSKGQVAYSASKGAVISMTKSMSKELAPYNIRVNAIAPGIIETEKIKASIKTEYKDIIPPIGVGRMGVPKDVANTCLYLAADLSEYVTGQTIVVSGGYGTVERFVFDL